jgi:hypothetical protein
MTVFCIREALRLLLGGVLFAASVIALLWAAELLEVKS